MVIAKDKLPGNRYLWKLGMEDWDTWFLDGVHPEKALQLVLVGGTHYVISLYCSIEEFLDSRDHAQYSRKQH